jgi:hypothetical protein
MTDKELKTMIAQASDPNWYITASATLNFACIRFENKSITIQ